MTRLEALIDLRKIVMDGTAFRHNAPERKARICEHNCLGGYFQDSMAYDAFHGSLDAAKALHDAVLPNCAFDVSHWPNGTSGVLISGTHEGQDGQRWHGGDDIKANGTDKDPARAWLIAIIQALIAQEGVDQDEGK